MALNGELLIVSAKITFMNTEKSGRVNPIMSGYRPNHVFERAQDNSFAQTFIGELEFDKNELIYPGKSKIVTVKFLKYAGIEQFLMKGNIWWLYEGRRLMAKGEIHDLLF